MKNKKPTDDELLSYIMGDLGQHEKETIEKWLEVSDKNRSHLKSILFLKKEIQRSPMIYRKKSWTDFAQVVAIRGGALCFAFIAGLLIQSHWQLLSNNSNDSGPKAPSLSQPLSLETQPTGKIL